MSAEGLLQEGSVHPTSSRHQVKACLINCLTLQRLKEKVEWDMEELLELIWTMIWYLMDWNKWKGTLLIIIIRIRWPLQSLKPSLWICALWLKVEESTWQQRMRTVLAAMSARRNRRCLRNQKLRLHWETHSLRVLPTPSPLLPLQLMELKISMATPVMLAMPNLLRRPSPRVEI